MTRPIVALISTIICCISLLSPATAVERRGPKPPALPTGGFSLSATLAGYFFAGSENRGAAPLYGLKIGYDKASNSLLDRFGVEGSLNFLETTSKADGGATGYLVRLDAIYPLSPGGKWVPFLALGAGGIFIKSNTLSESDPLLNYGGGLKYFFEDYLALRTDVRHLLVYSNIDTRNNFEVSVGLSYLFGKERKKKPAPPPKPTPKEIELKKKAIAEAFGEPAAAPAAATEAAKAAEDTAVPLPIVPSPLVPSPFVPLPIVPSPFAPAPEEIRPPAGIEARPAAPTEAPTAVQPETPVAAGKPETAVAPRPAAAPALPAPGGAIPTPVKPEQALPAPVLPLPAPAVIPQPLPQAPVAKVRRAVGRIAIMRLTVEFDVNSAAIKPKYYSQLRKIVETMKSADDPIASIAGHADISGRYGHNISLSLKRAASVKKYLVKHGADPATISTKGYGPSKPLADNATRAGKRKNRRADTTVTVLIYE